LTLANIDWPALTSVGDRCGDAAIPYPCAVAPSTASVASPNLAAKTARSTYFAAMKCRDIYHVTI